MEIKYDAFSILRPTKVWYFTSSITKLLDRILVTNTLTVQKKKKKKIPWLVGQGNAIACVQLLSYIVYIQRDIFMIPDKVTSVAPNVAGVYHVWFYARVST